MSQEEREAQRDEVKLKVKHGSTLVDLLFLEELDKDELVEKLAEVDGKDIMGLADGLKSMNLMGLE